MVSNMNDLYLETIPGKGRGVFAGKRFAAGAIIEIAPVIFLPHSNKFWVNVTSHLLDDYRYIWNDDLSVLAGGYGSFYNHSYTPNARYMKRYNLQDILYLALRDINPGDEITINYNGPPDDLDPVWFPVK